MEATREDRRCRNTEATREGRFKEAETSLGKTRHKFLSRNCWEAEIWRRREKTGEAETRRPQEKARERPKPIWRVRNLETEGEKAKNNFISRLMGRR